jgi:hypothetical protein
MVWNEWQSNSGDFTTYVLYVHGERTPSADIPQTGSASYNGQIFGDYASRVGTTNEFTVERRTVGGSISLTADFASSKMSASYNMTNNGTPIASETISGMNINNGQYSGSGLLNMSGHLYGPNAEETGGTLYGDTDADHKVNSIFHAKQ